MPRTRVPSPIAVLAVVWILAPHSSLAAVLRVPLDAATIQAAIDAAADGDTILVAPGIYTGDGNRDIQSRGKDFVLVSEAGAEATIIDAGAGPYPLPQHLGFSLWDDRSEGRIDGFTVRNAQWYSGFAFGAGIVIGGGTWTIANCIIIHNRAGGGAPESPSKTERTSAGCGVGGGLAVEGSGTRVVVVNCVFAENSSSCASGAIMVWLGADVDFEGCQVVRNRGSGIRVTGGGLCRLTNCMIAGTAAIVDDPGGALLVANGSSAMLDRTVVWNNCEMTSVSADSYLEATCSLIDTSMVDGAIVFTGQNVFEDPQFCDPNVCPTWAISDPGDYRVGALSPCLPANNACGVLIGASGECGATSVPAATNVMRIVASPNPFAHETTFALPHASTDADIVGVFDASGRRIKTLRFAPGIARIRWDGTDEAGQPVPSGTYLFRIDGAADGGGGRVTLVR